MSERTALIVGATKGIGLALTRIYLADGWNLIARTIEPADELDRLARRHGEQLEIRPLDITDAAAVASLRAALGERKIYVLHIVAGVFQGTFAPIWEQPDAEILRVVLHTNAIAGVRMAELFEPLVPSGGVFAFTSSGMGSMSRNDKGDVDLNRVSKAALNMPLRLQGSFGPVSYELAEIDFD